VPCLKSLVPGQSTSPTFRTLKCSRAARVEDGGDQHTRFTLHYPLCFPLLFLPTAALHVWKTVVTNTPKTLGELLPQLMAIIIESLADPGRFGISIGISIDLIAIGLECLQ